MQCHPQVVDFGHHGTYRRLDVFQHFEVDYQLRHISPHTAVHANGTSDAECSHYGFLESLPFSASCHASITTERADGRAVGGAGDLVTTEDDHDLWWKY